MLINMSIKTENLNLLEYLLKLNNRPFGYYVRDDSISYTKKNFSLMLMKRGYISMECILDNMPIMDDRNNTKILNYLPECTEDVLISVFCGGDSKSVKFILNKYKINLGKYFHDFINLGNFETIHKIIDRIHIDDLNSGIQSIIDNEKYELYYDAVRRRNLEVSKEVLKEEYSTRNMIFLGGVPKKEVMYKYVSILECKFPELIQDTLLKRISVWHSGRSKRIREYPGDLLIFCWDQN